MSVSLPDGETAPLSTSTRALPDSWPAWLIRNSASSAAPPSGSTTAALTSLKNVVSMMPPVLSTTVMCG